MSALPFTLAALRLLLYTAASALSSKPTLLLLSTSA